ncbi:MAG: hypothetical protein J0M17_15155 [Planctomycetes bacterium]|nr:hypothetical protein [Planctomycetota bacterium]
MTITDHQFDSEMELQTWAFANADTFFGNVTLLPGFRITTPAGKHGIPDGLAFNFDQRRWWLVECELLSHGVWPHIAEQITRFVVAGRNPATFRQVRDKLFESVLSRKIDDEVCRSLGTVPTRLLQQIELFIEGVTPSLAVFIDETNQDLLDCCDALDIPTEIYRVKKFIVNGRAEYYSPDRSHPAAIFDSDDESKSGSSVFDVISLLGGGEVVSSKNRCYRLADGRMVKIQYSKLHARHQLFWYGINPSSYNQTKALGCSHFIFVMGDEGFVVLPVELVDEYLRTAYVTNNPDGTTRHFHVHISPPPDVKLLGYANADDLDVSTDFAAFE